MSVYTAEHFRSDVPPARIVGTEMEYMIPVDSQNDVPQGAIINCARRMSRVGPERQMLPNGARLYRDMGMIEYATPESLGPLEATMTEMAGERLLRDAAEAVPGLDKPLYRRTGGYGALGLKSVGYHQNFLTLRYGKENDQLRDARVIGTYAITRVIWSGIGMLGATYGLSQKAHDIWSASEDGIFCIGSFGQRTTDKQKPVLSWSHPKTGGMEAHSRAWSRLELRYADAAHSPWARFMSMATGSLVLRLLEHKHRFPEQDWHDLCLKQPAAAVGRIAGDLDMQTSYRMLSSREYTALDIQQRFAEMALDLGDEITLPQDEMLAAREWLQICEDLRKGGETPEVAHRVRDRVEWAARLILLSKQADRLGESDVSHFNPNIAGPDILWDQTYPLAPAERYWRKQQADFFAKHDSGIDTLKQKPPRFTRAHVRGQLIKQHYVPEAGVWDRITSPSGNTLPLPDPYDYGG